MAGCFYLSIILSVVAFLFLIVLIQRKKAQLEFLIYILIFLIAVLLTKKQMAPNEFQQYITDEESGVKASITGVVTQVKRTDTSVQVQLKDCMLTPSQINQQTPVKCSGVLVTIQNTDCMPGDRVEVTGKVKNFSVMRNPGEFDQKTYYQTLKILFRCQAQSLIIKSHTRNEIVKALQTLKEKLDGAYDAVCEEKDAGIYKSIVLGEKEDLDQEIKNLYQESGIAHLLSISGVKTLCLVSPLSLESGLKWGFLRLHNAKKYIRNLCFKGQFLARCPSRFCGGKFQYNNLAKGYTFLRNYEQLSESK